MRTAFITGTGGFIGFHLAELLLNEGCTVAGFDGMTDSYDVRVKKWRIAILRQHPKFNFTQVMLEDDAVTYPWVDTHKAQEEYGITLDTAPTAGSYDGIIVAVSHLYFVAQGADAIRVYGRADHVLFDLKSVFAMAESDRPEGDWRGRRKGLT